MNQSLSELLANPSKLSNLDEDFILKKIDEEPFVQGWKILLAKYRGRKKVNRGFFSTNIFFASDFLSDQGVELKSEDYEEEKELIDLDVISENQSHLIDENEIEIIESPLLEVEDDLIDPIEDMEEKVPKKKNKVKAKKKAKKTKKSKKTIQKSKSKQSMNISSFEGWLKSLEPLEGLEKKKKKKEKKKKFKEHKLARKSVEKKKNLISEPLAELYLSQGHKNQAIEMYRQLSLVFPEKSAYFAAKISEINNLD